ncbi:hypothetical protein BKA70DRAFT_1241915 [Coprinopsis sp. MPI-PUGE-AT-0042]|nr:hypothetical protein BKA70DRAFT_1241915 [Coprinopsis sp. MPI-PUGE-AT-0042]
MPLSAQENEFGPPRKPKLICASYFRVRSLTYAYQHPAFHWSIFSKEIQINILSALNIVNLTSFADTFQAPSVRRHVDDRVGRLARHAGLSGSSLRMMLRETHPVVSGKGALSVLLPGSVVDDCLDVVCGKNSVGGVASFLARNGYTGMVSSTSADFHPGTHPQAQRIWVNLAIQSAVRSVSIMTNIHTGYLISIIQSSSDSPLALVVAYHSTLLMNWISWDALSCAYPALTMNYIVYNRVEKDLERYRARGFHIFESCTDLPYHSLEDCARGRSQEFSMPDGNQFRSDVYNLYCKWAVREVDDWATFVSPFEGVDRLDADDALVRWKLSHRYDEADSVRRDTKGRCRQSAWIEVKQNQSHRFTSRSDVESSSTGVDSDGELIDDDEADTHECSH